MGRKHVLGDALELCDDDMVNVFQECGLYKFFMCPNMLSQPLILQHLVDMWDLDAWHFMVGDQILLLEIEDVYFLNGLSRKGMTVVLAGGRRQYIDLVDR